MDTTQTFWSAVLSAPLPSVLVVVLGLVVLMVLVLAGAIIQFGTRLRHLATPIFDKIVKEAEEKAERILAQAREEGSTIRASAHTDAQKIFADRKAEDEQFRVEQVKHIEELTTHAKDLLNKQTSTISHLSEEIAIEFKKQAVAAQKILTDESAIIRQSITDESNRMKLALATVAEGIHNDYKGLMNETKRRLEEELAKEIESAREAVVAYRQQRLALLNKEIVGLVEDTTRIALSKSLSLGEHRDAILSALAEAKQEGVFGASSS